MNKTILVVGSKPYLNINFSNIIDKFGHIYRCNTCLPNNNNGTKYGNLAMCNHLYKNLIVDFDRERFFDRYEFIFKKEHMVFWADNIEKIKSSYDSIFMNDKHFKIKSKDPLIGECDYNPLLKEYGSPYKFLKVPRTGLVVIFDNLLKGNKIFVTHFSIHDEKRLAYHTKDEQSDIAYWHDPKNELQILRWLHESKYIDATLCMLEDKKIPTLKCNGMKPTKIIIDKIEDEFSKIEIIK